MEIIEKIIPKGRPNRPGYAMQPKYITIHDTFNTARGANALAHAQYLCTTDNKVSWHFTVDDQRIVQHLPLNEAGWHAGDGANGPGNRTSIGIEICENEDGDRARAETQAVELIVYLLRLFNLPIDAVVPHKHWTGKNCPHLLLPRWGEFVSRIQNELNPPAPPAPTWDPQEEINKLLQRGIIKLTREPEEMVTWGEFATVVNRIIS